MVSTAQSSTDGFVVLQTLPATQVPAFFILKGRQPYSVLAKGNNYGKAGQ